jgi:hypothetical protein
MAPQPLHFFKDFDPAAIKSTTIAPAKITQTGANVQVVPPTSNHRSNNGKGSRAVISDRMLSSYRLQLSKDARFANVVLEKSIPLKSAFDIKAENIPDGVYKMRVAFIDALGVQGEYSAPSDVVKDTVAPKITDVKPENNASQSDADTSCEVSGVADGAALVAVNNDVVFINAAGHFSKDVVLAEGPNKIRIVARDGQGNQTIVERTVIYSKSKKPGR